MNKNYNYDMSTGEMFSMVFGDASLYSQMLDAENMTEKELSNLATKMCDKLGANNISHGRMLSGLRNIA